MKKGFVLYGFLVFIVLLMSVLSLASASFSYQGNSIRTSYFSGEIIRGNINISFVNEPASSIVKTNYEGGIRLIDLLNNNSFVVNNDFNCTTLNCQSDYAAKEELTATKLDGNSSKMVGFRITGSQVRFESNDRISFTIKSNAPPSCFEQAWVNVLAKNETIIRNANTDGFLCDNIYSGCYNDSLSSSDYSEYDLGRTQYCEKIFLPPAPKYVLGANLNVNSTSDSDLVRMELFDEYGGYLNAAARCTLPINVSNLGSQYLSCSVDYVGLEPRTYFLCISAPTLGTDSIYRIKTERVGENCGTTSKGSTDAKDYSLDYSVFAKAFRYGAFEMQINESSFQKLYSRSLKEYANSYLEEQYGKECDKTPCFIPFEINGGIITQDITISDVLIRYQSSAGQKTDSAFFVLNTIDSKITSKNLSVDLSLAGFKVPVNPSDNKLSLYIGNSTVFSSLALNITKGFTFELNPRYASIAIDTEFILQTNDSITSSTWKFDDGSTLVSNGTKAVHRFTQIGEHLIEVQATNSKGQIGKNTFTIFAGNPKDSASQIIKRYETRINNVSRQLESYPLFVREAITKKVDIASINSSLTRIKNNYDLASTDADYAAVVNDLLGIKVPYAIIISSRSNSPIVAGYESIELSPIAQISGTTIAENQKTELKQALVSWLNDNYEGSITIETYFSFTDGGQSEPLVSNVLVETKKKDTRSDRTAYLIIGYPFDSIKFEQSYSERAAGTGAYIPLSKDSESFSFVIPDEVKIKELGIYISPEVRELDGYLTDVITPVSTSMPWGWIIFWIFIIIVITFVVYIVLQEWYKRNYEKYLFHNPNDLYNIMTFISNSRNAGLKDLAISSKLAGSGWNKEQINYAFKKFDGKRTGMYEIPIFRSFEQKKIKEEIEKRSQKGPDVRFIKRPSF